LIGYYSEVLSQSNKSFRWALTIAIVGFIFFLAAVAFLLFQPNSEIAVISLISGSLVEVISAIIFYLYGKTSSQLAEFQNRLDVTQRFLLANSICESLEGDAKQQARVELVQTIAQIKVKSDNEKDIPNTD